MGVPVITTLGDHHAARVSASLLRAAGHPELVAADTDEFARLAAALAGDLDRIGALRNGLRDELRASPLLDAKTYALTVHAALRNLFQEGAGAYARSR